MKKFIIHILVCLPIGMIAQESLGDAKIKSDYIKHSSSNFEIAYLENNKVVFSIANEGFTYYRDALNSKNFSGQDRWENTDNENLLSVGELVEDNKANLNEGMVTYSKDRKTVFFSVNRKLKNKKRKNEHEVKIKRSVNLQLFRASVNENGEWVNLEMLPFNSNQYSNGQPVLNYDDTKLYFVSDGPESLGRTDIFVVDLHENGTYGEPVNLGPKINSIDREIFPFIDKDNLLYFSSDNQNKRGVLDAFASRIFDNTVSIPIKLNGPLNIDKDDFTYNIDNGEQIEYLASSRKSVKQVDDIYALIDSSPINIECEQEISGIVKNVDTHELLANVQIMLFDKNNEKLLSLQSNESDGSFNFQQSCNTSYKLKGYLDGFLIGEQDITTVNDLNSEPMQIVINMSMEPSMEIELSEDLLRAEEKEVMQREINLAKTNQIDNSNDDANLYSHYNFDSDTKVYTVQIGAFQGNVQTDKLIKLSSVYNHLYQDGFNRYYSGVFESYSEAKSHMKHLMKDGYNDAFIVGLKGEKRY